MVERLELGDMVGDYRRWRLQLGQALDPRYHNQEWLDWMVMGGRAMCFSTGDCAVVAELRYYPSGAKDVFVICAAGDPIATRDVLAPRLEQWAKAEGCLAIMAESREAWIRLLSGVGWKLYKTAMRKDMCDG